ncbi:MAG TPA: sulfurtransferase [Vicinamibacterales bacterium]|jgi:thiosulfate/3-mercaptopyruvate sulfurtransferase|nr:sulfurtransferase [Vicinamibacterales bacterium]
MTHTTLVSTDTLAAHTGEWAVVDCRFDLANEAWGRDQYAAGHIPGAVYAHLNDDLSGPRTGTNGRHPMPSDAALVALLERLGIGNDTQVVAYDQDAGSYASRLWWLFRYAGHRAAAVLDGGFAKWVAEGRPVRPGQDTRARATFRPSFDRGLVLSVDEVARRREDGRTLLVDARAAERFEGRSETIDKVAGHIPGARNRFFRDNLTPDGTMLPPDALRAAFTGVLDGRVPRDAVMYCGSGVTACHNLLAMEHAGLPGSPLYTGSWSEWSADPSRPIETGPARKERGQP